MLVNSGILVFFEGEKETNQNRMGKRPGIRRFLLVLMLSGLFPAAGTGQILNIDRLSMYSDTMASRDWYTLFSAGFMISKQKVEVIQFNTSLDLTWLRKRNPLMILSKVDYTSSGGFDIINSGFGHIRYRIMGRHGIHPEFFLQYQWDAIRGLENRSLLGSNLRFDLQKDSLGSLFLAAGMMYERENWNYYAVPDDRQPADPGVIETERIKLNLYLKVVRKLGRNTDLSVIAYYQATPDDELFKPRISTSLVWHFNISQWLGFRLQANSLYDFAPVVPIRKHYFDLSNALTITF